MNLLQNPLCEALLKKQKKQNRIIIKIAHIVTNKKAATNGLITSFVAVFLPSNCQRWDYIRI